MPVAIYLSIHQSISQPVGHTLVHKFQLFTYVSIIHPHTKI